MLKYPSVQQTKGKAAAAIPAAAVRDTSPSKQPQRRLSRGSTIQAEIRYVLKWKEFLCYTFIWETPLLKVVDYMDIIIAKGGMVVFLAYFIFSMGVAMPLYTLLLFWGNYTKRGYIKFWDMVPLLKGMTWSVSVFSIFLELFNVSIGGLALVYASSLFTSKVPWSNCNFKGATNACYPMFPTTNYTLNCTPGREDNVIHFPAYEYFLTNKIHAPTSDEGYESAGQLQIPWVISVCFTWFIIYLLLMLGFKKFRTVISNIAFTFAVIFFIPTFHLTIFKSRQFARPPFMASKFTTLFDLECWISILSHSLTGKLPGNFLVLGSHAPASMKPDLNVFCAYGMKYVCFLFLMIWLSTSTQIVQLHYKVQDINCLPLSGRFTIFLFSQATLLTVGLSLMFAIIPDMFSRFPVLPQIPLFLYFFGLWYFGLLSAVYTITAFYESITEAKPGIYDMKVYFCAILCIICCLINMMLLTSLYLSVMETWTKFGFAYITIILSLIFSFGVFIYSVRKYGNDYYFMYGKPLGSFWANGLKFSLLISFIFFALIASNCIELKMRYPTNTIAYILCYVFMVVLLAPILLVAVWIYLKYKNRGRAVKAITPTADWGPPSITDKLIRSRFNPKREIRIKNEMQRCRHNCLLNSQRIKDEIQALQKNRARLATSLGMTDYEEET